MAVQTRKGVDDLPIFIPAKSKQALEEELGRGDVIKLAANENRHGCSPKVLPAIIDAAKDFYLYPDVGSPIVREAIANYHNINPENIIFGSGLFEVTLLIAQAYLEKGDQVISPAPTFGWYGVASLHGDADVVSVPLREFEVDLDDVYSAITEKTKIIWLCNPNNPTGRLIPAEALEKFINKVPDNILLVIDEAYMDYSDRKYESAVKYLDKFPNLVIQKTFSKLYGLASFRIGYALANKTVIEAVNKVKQPLNVNFLAQIAAKASIEDSEFRDMVYYANKAELKRYYDAFKRLGLPYVESEASFVLVKVPDSVSFVEKLSDKGIMIREGSRFGLGEGWVRISVGTKDDNVAVIDAFNELL